MFVFESPDQPIAMERIYTDAERIARREIGARDRHIAFFVFGFLLACYLFTYTGIIQSSDGLAMFATAESFVRGGRWDSNQLLWMGNQQGNLGPDGNLYSRKGLGMTLLAIPLLWLAKFWPNVGLVQAALLLNPLLTAWTGALLFRTGRRLGWNRNASVMVALIFGLATLAWPYTQTFFSDPVCAFGLYGAFYGLLSFDQTGRKQYLFSSGLAWGLAYLARVVNLVTLPIFLIGLIFVLLRQSPGLASGRDRLRGLLVEHWRPLVSFLVPVVLAGLISLWWNWVRYGSIWESGYVESERFSAVWWFGIYGLLFGPARGLLWYSPALLLGLVGGRWFWQRARPALAISLALTVTYVLLYGKWYMWHGGYSWGPRFLVPLMPFLALLTGPAWMELVQQRRWGVAGRVGALLLVAISIGVQWLGMLVPFGLVQDWLAAQVEPLFAPVTFTQWRYSPLVLQWRFLQPEHIHLAWWRMGMGPQAVHWLNLLLPGAVVALGVVLLTRHLRAAVPPWQGRATPEGLYGAALGGLALAILIYNYSALGDPQMQEAARRIEQQERPGDAILMLLPEKTQHFANAYHGDLPTFGFLPRGSLEPAEEAWLARLQATYARLWVLPDATLPEQSGWERPLRINTFLLMEKRLTEQDGQRLALYAMPQAYDLQEAGLGTIFGDPAQQGEEIDEENGWIRLKGYALTTAVEPGGELLLMLRWESLRPVDYNYQVFIHLLNQADEKVAQRDGQPVQWMRPTSTWQPGEEIPDRYGMLLPEDIPPGSYTIAVGLYDPVSGQRLPVSAGPQDYAIELGPIQVAPHASR
ncbi:MAG: hypothetical protein KatS3mg050_0432 [Litorilinea sp.]|nr:MAG: hypothetical protein KatS3mg050_0432 [Litorilinea sp.]